MPKSRPPFRLASLIALVLCAASMPARADDSAVLRALQSIGDRMTALEARMDRLEGRAPAAQAPAAAPPAAMAAPVAVPPSAAAAPAPAAAPVAAAPAALPAAALPQAVLPTQVPAAAAPGYVSPEAALKSTWALIQRDVPQAEVTRLLGEPTRKFTVDGRTVWYYIYPSIGVGSIFFTDAGRVSSRQSPFPWGG
ncbi:MAG: hypothetical protein KGL43_22240 [Burkholderiales bacterium]|nr:hypothetical protein [Burkholderiales bacterium]